MENIYNSSDRLINLIDVPGIFDAFSKTILYSASAIKFDNIIICIPSTIDNINDDEFNIEQFIYQNENMYKFIIYMCVIYNIEPIIIITKYDLITNIYNYNNLLIAIKIFNKWKNDISNDIIIDKQNINFTNCIKISNITNFGYSDLYEKLALMSMINNENSKNKIFNDKKLIFIFYDVFKLDNNETICYGVVLTGSIHINDKLNIFWNGRIIECKIKTIRSKNINVNKLMTNETGSITIHNINKIDKTAIIIDPYWIKNIVHKVKCISLFKSIILKNQQYTLFVGNNIVPILLIPNINFTYDIISVNNIRFFVHNDNHKNIGILKDAMNNYFFVKFIDMV